jgi:predicted enzyme related to lactoylglutathione lyase
MTVTGKFNWYELMTSDPGAAGNFYEKVIGWKASPMGQAGDGSPYTVFETPAGGVAGMMGIPAEAGGMPPAWVGYIAVDNCDDYTKRFEAAGGTVLRPPADIPGIGRFSVVSDPQGAVLNLFTPLPREDGAAPPAGDGPGYPSWRELMTTDGPKAVEFYSSMFGWEKSTPHDMGPMGVYQLMAYDGADRMGIMTRPAQMPMSHWGFVFGVDSANAVAERIKAAGGTVTNGPMQVPGGSWIVQAQDPQGAHFSTQSLNA